MNKLKIAYFGTPYFSALFLEKLLTDVLINRLIDTKFVVTQPDHPVGRKQILTKSPVKIVAEKYDIPVISDQLSVISKNKTEKLTTDYRKLINELKKVDMALLYAYGGVIPKEIIDIPKLGFWNIHPSLLPKYRGALPIAMPLILGDKETGVTLIKLDEKVDHGPIIAQEKSAISPTDKRPNLEVKLTDLAYEMFKKKVSKLISTDFNRFQLTQQDHSKATYTYQLKKDDGFIPLSVLKKALRNEPISFEEVPKIIKEYYLKYEDQQKTRFAADYLWANSGEELPSTRNLSGSELVRDSSLSSNISLINKNILVKPKNSRRGDDGNRTRGTMLERLAPDQPIPTQNLVYQKYDTAKIIYNLFRGLYPWPGLWTLIRVPPRIDQRLSASKLEKRLKITDLELSDNKLIIKKVQLEGKNVVDFKTFNSAYSIF